MKLIRTLEEGYNNYCTSFHSQYLNISTPDIFTPNIFTRNTIHSEYNSLPISQYLHSQYLHSQYNSLPISQYLHSQYASRSDRTSSDRQIRLGIQEAPRNLLAKLSRLLASVTIPFFFFYLMRLRKMRITKKEIIRSNCAYKLKSWIIQTSNLQNTYAMIS